MSAEPVTKGVRLIRLLPVPCGRTQMEVASGPHRESTGEPLISMDVWSRSANESSINLRVSDDKCRNLQFWAAVKKSFRFE